jgi:hypothetical protein
MDYMALKAKNKALNSEEARTGKVYLKSKPVFFSLEGVRQVSADKPKVTFEGIMDQAFDPTPAKEAS